MIFHCFFGFQKLILFIFRNKRKCCSILNSSASNFCFCNDIVETNTSQTTNGTNNVVPPILNSAPNIVPSLAIPIQKYSNSTWREIEEIQRCGFQKMLFYLIILNLARFLSKDPLAVQEATNNWGSIIALDAWKHSDFSC